MIDWQQHSQYVPLISGDSHSVMDQGFPRERGGEPTPAGATNLLFDMKKHWTERARASLVPPISITISLSLFYCITYPSLHKRATQ